MPRRLIINMVSILSVICAVIVGIVTNMLSENSAPIVGWAKSNIGWVLITITLVSIVLVLLTQSMERNEQRPTLVPRSLMKKPTRRNYRKLYLERLIYRYRDFDMKGFSTRGIY